MKTTKNGWTIVDEAAGVLFYTYSFAKEGLANCFAARLPDGNMLVLSPACRMPDGAFDDLLEFGQPTALVATNGFHYLGVPQWRERFPEARVFAAPETAARVHKQKPEAGDFEPLSGLTPLLGDGIGVIEVPDTKCGETWAWVRTTGGHVWYVSDTLANIEQLPSNFLFRLAFKLTKSAPGYRVFGLAMMIIAKDKKRVLARLRDDLREHPPNMVIPAHGEPVVDDVSARTEQLLAAAVG